ncbi:hypothetical protein [Spiroplasma endosymbiont of Polydrusus formosus]|uniref:hypothetical protein n=1 Tax=Spiroplasma endosymbiont of Polydrusus formosus TaxID=3139326 RepID=UPI0035B5502D
MSKIMFKDVIVFLKIFGISSLFFVSGIVILIIKTIRYIKTHNKNVQKDLDILKNYLNNTGYLSLVK